MDEKGRKNMYYHCDKMWNPSYNCWGSKIYLIQGEEESLEPKVVQLEPKLLPSKEEGLDDDLNHQEPEISLATISSTPTANTMRLDGRIGDVSVVVLVDSGSVHNFLDLSIVKKTMLTINS